MDKISQIKDKNIVNTVYTPDPYDQFLTHSFNRLEAPKIQIARRRKWRNFQAHANRLFSKALNGFVSGAMVGSSIGLLFGIYYGVQNKSLLIVPLSAIISGCSFGFFAACGSMVKSQEIPRKKLILLSQNPLLWKY